MYIIEQIPSDHRIELFFDKFEDHDSARFLEDIQDAALNVKGCAEYFDMLSDFSQSMVMPQNIANHSKELVDWLLANGLRKSANIMQTTTQRMQIARVTQRHEKFEYFATRQEALDWLEEGRP